MEHHSLGVFFVLDYQVNDFSDMFGFIGGTINIVDQDFSRQLMSLYVLQLNLTSMNIPVAPESTRASTNMGVLLSMVLRHSGMSVPLRSEVDHTRKGFPEG